MQVSKKFSTEIDAYRRRAANSRIGKQEPASQERNNNLDGLTRRWWG